MAFAFDEYSSLPTKDMDQAFVGSAISAAGKSGSLFHFFGVFSFLDLLEKRRGEKHVARTTHDGWMQVGSAQ